MDQSVTTNPWTIMLINMTVVFAVLYGLSLIIKFISLIDPTKLKSIKTTNAQSMPPAKSATDETEEEIVVILTAAIAAYGYGQEQIAFIRRRTGGENWVRTGRMLAVQARNQQLK